MKLLQIKITTDYEIEPRLHYINVVYSVPDGESLDAVRQVLQNPSGEKAVPCQHCQKLAAELAALQQAYATLSAVQSSQVVPAEVSKPTYAELTTKLAEVRVIPEPQVALSPEEELRAAFTKECAEITPGTQAEVMQVAYGVFTKYKQSVLAANLQNAFRTALVSAIADCLGIEMSLADELMAAQLKEQRTKATPVAAAPTTDPSALLQRWNAALADPRVTGRKTAKQVAAAALAVMVAEGKSCSVSAIKAMCAEVRELTAAPYDVKFWAELTQENNGKSALDLLARAIPPSLGYSTRE